MSAIPTAIVFAIHVATVVVVAAASSFSRAGRYGQRASPRTTAAIGGLPSARHA